MVKNFAPKWIRIQLKILVEISDKDFAFRMLKFQPEIVAETTSLIRPEILTRTPVSAEKAYVQINSIDSMKTWGCCTPTRGWILQPSVIQGTGGKL